MHVTWQERVILCTTRPSFRDILWDDDVDIVPSTRPPSEFNSWQCEDAVAQECTVDASERFVFPVRLEDVKQVVRRNHEAASKS